MRTGRPPEEGATRDFVLSVRLTPTDVQNLDAVRGSTSRSAFARQSIRDAAAAKGQRK